MSHFSVMVFVDPKDVDETDEHTLEASLDEAVEALLAPYDEDLEVEPYVDEIFSVERVKEYRKDNDDDDLTDLEYLSEYYGQKVEQNEDGSYTVFTTYNKKSKWDWYSEGGRFQGQRDKRGLAITRGRIEDIDVHRIRTDAGYDAERLYNDFERVTKGLDPAISWKAALEKHDGDVDAARAFYHAQPAVKACRDQLSVYRDPIGFFKVDEGGREAFVAGKVHGAVATYAYVTPEGEWVEKGKMGWFGMSSDEVEDWPERYAAYFDALPKETYFVQLDCHI